MTEKGLIVPSDYASVINLVTDSVRSLHSKVAYKHALVLFLDWRDRNGRPALSRASVQAYRSHLEQSGKSSSTINQHLSAIRALAREASANGLLDDIVRAQIKDVDGEEKNSIRTGNWMTIEEAQILINAPDVSTLRGVRDRAILFVMITTGLRRSEVATLEFEHMGRRENRWVIVDILGKRQKTRSIPMSDWCKAAIDMWASWADLSSGKVFRAIGNNGKVVRDALSPQSVYDIVTEYSRLVGFHVAPHDLRRTFAKLSRDGGSSLEQIQLSLGHSNLKTTQDYLGTIQSIVDAPSDHINLHL